MGSSPARSITMAVDFERFSIREYAAKMRSVDYGKGWPFEGGEGRLFLPEMPVRKFRWWADELPAVRVDAEKPDGVLRPGVDLKKGRAAAELATGHRQEQPLAAVELPADDVAAALAEAEDGRQVRPQSTPSKMKQRTPKKRSIVELFAVSPPVKAIESMTDRSAGGREDHEGDDDGAGKLQGERFVVQDGNLRSRDRDGISEKEASKGRKRRLKEEEPRSKEKIGIKKAMKKKKKKKKKKRLMKKNRKSKLFKVENNLLDKDKTCKLKMPSVVNVFKVHKNKSNKLSGNMQTLLSQKKTATVRTLNAKHIFKLARASKLISKNQKVSRLRPVNPILMNRKRCASAKKGKMKGLIKGSDLVELCCESAKQLNFPGKDGRVDHKERCVQLELPNLKNLCKIISDVLAASSINHSSKHPCVTEEAQLENIQDQRVLTRSVDIGEASLERKQVCGTCNDIIDLSSGGTKKIPLAQSLDLNYPMQDYVDLTCFSLDSSTLTPSDGYTGSPRVLDHVNKARASGDCGILQEQSISFMSDNGEKIYNANAKCSVVSNPAKSSMGLMRKQSLHQSSSCSDRSMDSNEGQCNQPVFTKKNVCDHCPERVQFELQKGIGTCSSAFEERRLALDLTSSWKESCTEEGFIGLPVNSQGALIQLHPNTRFEYGELHKRSKSASNSLHVLSSSYYTEPHSKEQGKFPYLPLYLKDPHNWFLNQYCPSREVVTSDYGSSEFQGLEKLKDQTDKVEAQFTDSDFRKLEVSYSGRSNASQSESCFEKMKLNSETDQYSQPSVQQSMRLMGKNVIVGRISKETQGCYEGNVWTDKEIINQSCPTRRVHNGSMLNRYSQDECILHAEVAPSREILLPSLEATSSCPFTPSSGLTCNHRHLKFGQQWMLRDGDYSATEHQGLVTGVSSGHVPLQNLQYKTFNSTVNCNLKNPFVDLEQPKPVWASYPEKVSENMLLHSIPCKHSQTISYSNSSTFSPPFLDEVPWSFGQAATSHSSRSVPHWLLNATNQHPAISYCPVTVQQPCSMPTNFGFPVAPASQRPVTFFPCNGNRISQTYGFSAPISSVYTSSLADLSSSKFSYVNPYGNRKTANNVMEFNFSHVNVQDHCRKNRKRPSAQDDILVETVKKRNLKVHEDSPSSADLARREQLNGDVEKNTRAYGSRTIEACLPVMNKEKDCMTASTGPCALTTNCETRSGGVRVSVGTKHQDSMEASSMPCLTTSHSQTTTGPVKLSAGAKHILRPSQSMDQDNARPIHSTIPLAQGTGIDRASAIQTIGAKVYRF